MASAATSVDEVRARRGALQYWQQEYDALLPDRRRPGGGHRGGQPRAEAGRGQRGLPPGPGALQGRPTPRSRRSRKSASAYFAVLKNSAWHEDAAYNYEYIVRLRDEQAKGKQPPKAAKRRQESTRARGARRRRRRARRASRSTFRSRARRSRSAATPARRRRRSARGRCLSLPAIDFDTFRFASPVYL